VNQNGQFVQKGWNEQASMGMIDVFTIALKVGVDLFL
jgi:hypothetical protein